jgi:hypothetical protein
MMGLILKHFQSYIPRDIHFLADLPILDDYISKAVFEAIENKSIEGICDGDRIRLLANRWELKMLNSL